MSIPPGQDDMEGADEATTSLTRTPTIAGKIGLNTSITSLLTVSARLKRVTYALNVQNQVITRNTVIRTFLNMTVTNE